MSRIRVGRLIFDLFEERLSGPVRVELQIPKVTNVKVPTEILAKNGWTVPEGYMPDNIARCRSCDAEILWTVTKAGKKAPLNRDGTSHFSTCPAAEQWRTPRSRMGGS